jgi:hypothetical protein
MQWAYVNDIEISQNCLGLALFPDEFEVGLSERIRKVVGPMARKVCRENFADMLREQALEAEPEPSESIPGKWRCVFLTEEGEFTFTPDPSRPLRFLF